MFNVSDAAYDNFMGRFSMPLAPVFADFAGIASGQHVLDVGAGTGALTSELVRRAPRRRGRSLTVLRRSAAQPASGVDVQGGRREPPVAGRVVRRALAQLVITFMRDAPAGREMHRVVRPGGVSRSACGTGTGWRCSRPSTGRRRYSTERPNVRTANEVPHQEEIEQLIGVDAEFDLLEVGPAIGFDELWSAVVTGAGPAGEWAKSLDTEHRREARAELYRQVGEPEGPFTLRGRAWAARVTRA